MKNKLFLIMLTLLAFNSPNIDAQEVLSIEEAVKIALENNYSIKIARNEAEISDNNFTAGNAGFFPKVNADASYNKSINDTKQEYLDGRVVDRTGAESNTLNAGITLDWTIFDGLRMFTNYTLLKELRNSGKANLKASLENNIADIISTYYLIYSLEQVIEVVMQSVAVSEERVRIAADKKELGSASKFELLQAQVNLNEDKAMLLREEVELIDAKRLLNRLMGRNVEADYNVTDTIIVNAGLNYDELKEETFEQNSSLQLARQGVVISGLESNLAGSEWFPSLGVYGGYDYLHSESEAGFVSSNQNKGWSYGVTARINIFDGLNTSRRIENAQIAEENSELRLIDTENEILSRLLSAYNNYSNSLRLVELENANFQVAAENVDIALERLRLGSIAPLEFRESQRGLINAKSSLATAQLQAKNAETNLLLLSGRLVK